MATSGLGIAVSLKGSFGDIMKAKITKLDGTVIELEGENTEIISVINNRPEQVQKKEYTVVMPNLDAEYEKEPKKINIEKHRPKKRWTNKEIGQIKSLISKGKTYQQIARKFGVSRDALYSMLYDRKIKNGISRKSWCSNEIKQILDLTEQGKSQSEIAKIIGRRQSSVYNKLRNIRKEASEIRNGRIV